jgi:hypothetical protein
MSSSYFELLRQLLTLILLSVAWKTERGAGDLWNFSGVEQFHHSKDLKNYPILYVFLKTDRFGDQYHSGLIHSKLLDWFSGLSGLGPRDRLTQAVFAPGRCANCGNFACIDRLHKH